MSHEYFVGQRVERAGREDGLVEEISGGWLYISWIPDVGGYWYFSGDFSNDWKFISPAEEWIEEFEIKL